MENIGSGKIMIEPDYDAKICSVTLNNPPLNIVSEATYREITEAMRKVDSLEGICCVVIKANGRHFCGGAELEFIRDCGTPEAMEKSVQMVNDCMNSIYFCRYPVITAINGQAVGAGTVMATCSDVVIMAENSAIRMAEYSAGYIGGAEFLEMIAPRRWARYYIYTGEKITAQKCLQLGICMDVVPEDKLLERTYQVAAKIAAQSPLMLKYCKKALNYIDDDQYAKKYEFESHLALEFHNSHDFLEYYNSFKEHRPPVFTGK